MSKIELTKNGKGQLLYKEAKKIIPGGLLIPTHDLIMLIVDYDEKNSYYEVIPDLKIELPRQRKDVKNSKIRRSRKEILETQLRLKHLILIKQERRMATKSSHVKGVGNALHDLHCAVGMVILQGVDLGKRGHDSRQSHHRRPALATQSRQQDENHKKMPTLHEF